MKKRLLMISTVLWLVLGLSIVSAQDETQGQIDQPFVQAAAEGDLYELTSSEMAVNQSSNEDVQAFAQRMIEDHTMTTEQLTQLAQSLGFELPTMPGAPHQVMLAQLSNLQGAEFDSAYMNQQVVAHMVAVSLFEIAAASAENEELRAFAEECLPGLQEHLAMAQELQQGLQGQ